MTRTVSFSLLFFTMAMGLLGPQAALAVSDMASERGVAAAENGPQGRPAAPRFAEAMLDLDENGLADGLEAHLETLGDGEAVQVIVSLTAAGRARAFARLIGPFDVIHEFDVIDGFAAVMTAGQVRALAALPGIFRIEEDLTAEALLDVSRRSVGVDAAAALASPNPDYSGAGVTVCVVDSGAMGNHEMFNEPGAPSRFLGFSDSVGTPNLAILGSGITPYDDNFLAHGTHITGMIGGDGIANGGSVVEGSIARGVAPGVDFLIARTMDQLGRGLVSDIVNAIDWCMAQPSGPADIINLSLGVPGETRCRDALCRAAEGAVNDGAVVVAAIGNSGDAPGTAFSPAISRKVIGVGAAAEFVDYVMDSGLGGADARLSGGLHPLASNSQGPGSKGSVKPDVIAPGSTTLSAANDDHVAVSFNIFGELVVIDENADRDLCTTDCYTLNISGSSQAAAFVSGIAALMLEGDPSLTPAEVQQILQQTADDRLMPGPDNITGYGLVNAYDAVAAAAGIVPDPDIPAQPHKEIGSVLVPAAAEGHIDVPIQIQDPNLSFAVTLAIKGEIVTFDIFGQIFNEWTPDIDVWLYFGDSDNLGPLIAFSGCPAATCGTQSAAKVGQMEVLGIIFTPDDFATYGTDLTLRLASQVAPFHAGDAGVVHYDISNGKVVAPPPSGPPLADAGPDQSVTDSDNDGFAQVTLDASGSSGVIDDYLWQDAGGGELATGPNPTITLAQGTHTITLIASNLAGGNDSDEVVITVKRKKGGGGGGGGGGGCGKGNNPPC